MAVASDAQGSLRAALRIRDFRLLLGGLAVSKAGDWLYVVGLQVFVFQQTHSAAWVAATTVLRLVPAGLLAPLGGALADRYERRLVMISADLTRAALMFVLALVAWRSGSAAVALGLAFAASLAGSPNLPAAGAMTPAIVPETDLAAANYALSVIDNVAIVAGPALGGLLLLLGSPTAAFAVNGVSFFGSALAVLLMRSRSRSAGAQAGESIASQLVEGWRAVATSPGGAVVVGFVAASSLLYGLQTVLLLVLSARQLNAGASGYGYLLAGLGVGGVAAGLVSGRLAATERPSLLLTVALAGIGLPLAALAFVHSVAAAIPLLAVQGAANILVDVTAFTLLQRALPDALLARVFGFLETAIIGSILLGAVVAPWLLQTIGLDRSLLVAGVTVPVIALLLLPLTKDISLAAMRSYEAVRIRYDLFARLPVFEGTPRPALELLARSAEAETGPAGQVIIRQGDPADALFVVGGGELDVVADRRGAEVQLNRLHEGDYFGEIGILRQVPRTATVRAATPVHLYRVAADDFLAAVNQSPSLSGLLMDGIATRLARQGRRTPRQPAARRLPAESVEET